MALIAEDFTLEPAGEAERTATVERTAAEVAARGAGTPADLAHVFVTAARLLEVPAR